MKGIVADVNIQGHVNYLMVLVRAAPWNDLWDELGLQYVTFQDLGLADSEIWQRCQDEAYVLVTDNRNRDGQDSLEATIRLRNTPRSLPVLTIGKVQHLQQSRDYAEAVVERLLATFIDIEEVRGAGRLYLP